MIENYECWEIAGHTVEYLDDLHQYIVDGECLPSITQCLKFRFGDKYVGVDRGTLQKASEKGSEMHLAIQNYEEQGIESDLKELRNYKFLKSQYEWECLECEIPVILFEDDEPIACGRVDMVANLKGQMGIFDLKRTYALDKEYLGFQLNLYRIAYKQSYGKEAEILRGIHLRDDVRKFVTIPINEDMAWGLVHEYLKVAKE